MALSPGTTASAFLVVAVPSDGRVRLSNLSPGPTTASATVNGYYAAPCGGGGAGYEPAGPGWSVPRTAKLAPGQAAVLPAAEAGGGAAPVAVALDVRADEQATAGSLTVGPDEPGAVSGAATGFRLVNLGPSGRVRLSNGGSAGVTATLRVHGWYRRGRGTSYRTAGPEPLLDRTVPAGATARFTAIGVAGVPAAGVGAVALELWASGAGSGQVEVAGGAARRRPRLRHLAGRRRGRLGHRGPAGSGLHLPVRHRGQRRPAARQVRAPGPLAPGEVHGYWTFWDGTGWNSDPASSARLSGARAGDAGGQEPVTGIPSGVVRAGASYLELSATDDGHEIIGRLGCSPAGPWGAPRVLRRAQQGDVAYLARAYQDGPGMLLAFSLAPLDQRRLFAQASTYLPRFVRVR